MGVSVLGGGLEGCVVAIRLVLVDGFHDLLTDLVASGRVGEQVSDARPQARSLEIGFDVIGDGCGKLDGCCVPDLASDLCF